MNVTVNYSIGFTVRTFGMFARVEIEGSGSRMVIVEALGCLL